MKNIRIVISLVCLILAGCAPAMITTTNWDSAKNNPMVEAKLKSNKTETEREIDTEIDTAINSYLSLKELYPEIISIETEINEDIKQSNLNWVLKAIEYSYKWEEKKRPRLIIAFKEGSRFILPVQGKISPVILDNNFVLSQKKEGVLTIKFGSGEIGASLTPEGPRGFVSAWHPGTYHVIKEMIDGLGAPDYLFKSSQNNPLKFYVNFSSYSYESGKGIIELNNGPIILLGYEQP